MACPGYDREIGPDGEGCPQCQQFKDSGAQFCGACGRALVRPRSPLSALDKILLACAGIVTLVLLSVTVAAILGLGSTYDAIADGMGLALYTIIPTLIKVATLQGTGLGVYWTFVFIAFLSCVALTLWQSRGLFSRKGIEDVGSVRETPMYWIGILFGSAYIIQIVMLMVMNGLGVDVGTPDLPQGNSGDAIISYTNAGVWEEIVSRIVPIGIPMMLLALYKRYDRPYMYLFGGFGMSKVAVVLILISSVFFAYAHYDGWGAFKIPMVMVGGLIMGWLFVRFGVHASIAFHCMTDLLTVAVAAIPGFNILVLAVALSGLVTTCIVFMLLYRHLRTVRDLPLVREGQYGSIFRRRD